MSNWETNKEEASIVIVGNFNPKIFHPEWFIRKEIVEEWEYESDKLANLPDISQVQLPNNMNLRVLLNQFVIRTSRASDFWKLGEFVVNTFSELKETPIKQLGMNFTSVIRMKDMDSWYKFGSELAPKKFWSDAVGYLSHLEKEKSNDFGLWDITMNFPRPDENLGHIRPRITGISAEERTLSFSINNHFEIEDSNINAMLELISSDWEESISFAKELISNIMNSQLGD